MDKQGKILIVDDDASLLKTMKRQLGRMDYEVLAVDDPTKIADSFQKLKEKNAERLPVDLIIIDYRMPGMDGLSLFLEIRDFWEDMPVFMMTGDHAPDLPVEFLRAGGDNYFAKPLDFNQLGAAIRQVLQRKKLEGKIRALQKELEAADGVFDAIVTMAHQVGLHGKDLLALTDAEEIPRRPVRAKARQIDEGLVSIVTLARVQLVAEVDDDS